MQIGCIGAGSWGTTLAVYLADLGHSVSILAYEPDQIVRLREERENATYLPGITFPDTLSVASTIDELVDVPLLLVATPTQYVRSSLSSLVGRLSPDTLIVNASKGIEKNSELRVSEIIEDVLGIPSGEVVTLSGPSHAEEVSRGVPTALVAGSESLENAHAVQQVCNSEKLRVYTSSDLVGVELGGSLKNVIALCAGIVDGLDLGDNTKAALLTRGLAEITRLGVALGAQAETFSGLSGLGDLIVTCTSGHSRNRYVGEQLGLGRTLQEIIGSMEMVAEGVATTESARDLARHHDVEMPIIEQVYEILFNGKAPMSAIEDLMSRPPISE